jgi:5-methylcytosine-specific restriction endonuclease McrA
MLQSRYSRLNSPTKGYGIKRLTTDEERILKKKFGRIPTGKVKQEQRKCVKAFLMHVVNGACQLCGYDKAVGNLTFHHLNPSTKKFGLSGSIMANLDLHELIAEASRCALLCANCHGEINAGMHVEDLKPLNYNKVKMPESVIVWYYSK